MAATRGGRRTSVKIACRADRGAIVSDARSLQPKTVEEAERAFTDTPVSIGVRARRRPSLSQDCRLGGRTKLVGERLGRGSEKLTAMKGTLPLPSLADCQHAACQKARRGCVGGVELDMAVGDRKGIERERAGRAFDERCSGRIDLKSIRW